MKKASALVAISLLTVFMLAGCGPPKIGEIHYTSDLKKYPGIVKKNTREEYDEFQKHTWIIGPRGGIHGQYTYLRALADNNKVVQFIQIYLNQTEWDRGGGTGYDFHSAYDADGNKLQFVKMAHETGWQISEYWYQGELRQDHNHFSNDQAAAIVSYKKLDRNRHEDLRVKFYGKNGNRIATVGASYVDEYLSVLEERYDLKRLK